MVRRNWRTVLSERLIKDHSLGQIDETYLRSLGLDELLQVALKLAADLKEARERLERTPSTSSLPPSSLAPWQREGHDETPPEEGGEDSPDEAPAGTRKKKASARKGAKQHAERRRRPGKQPGAPGRGRTQRLAITETVHHGGERCALCEHPAAPELAEQQAWTAMDLIDLSCGDEAHPGIAVTNTRHRYYQWRCRCGHLTRTEPHRGRRAMEGGRDLRVAVDRPDAGGVDRGADRSGADLAPRGARVSPGLVGAERPRGRAGDLPAGGRAGL